MMKNISNKTTYLSALLPCLILLLGIVPRLLLLGKVPYGMHQDESFVAWNAFAVFHEQMDSAGHVLPVYMADWGDGHSALYVWLTLPLLLFSGGHITHFLARLPQALVSIATLPAVFGIVRRTLGRKQALWCMFVLAICPWHIMMSRWGLDANLAPGFLIFGLYFFILGLNKPKYLLASAFVYGLSLYAYAVIWPIVPFLLLLQVTYAVYCRKIRLNRYSMLSVLILFLMALPLLLFIGVNSGFLPEIKLPFMTIPAMGGYRGDEVAFDLTRMYKNLRTTLSLLWHQKTGAPYDILLPWGLFYDMGRAFMIIGAACMVYMTLRDLMKRQFSGITFLFIQLLGGGLCCLLVTAVLHQINALYIPLVLCEGYGVWVIATIMQKYLPKLNKIFPWIAVIAYLICFVGFQRDYYGDYQKMANAYFGAGLEECVDYAMEACEQQNLRTITVEKGAQWPRLLLYTETKPSEYLSSVVYDVPPAPAAFQKGNLTIRTRINYEQMDADSVYIIYYTDQAKFEADYTLTPFYDWYVAVPK